MRRIENFTEKVGSTLTDIYVNGSAILAKTSDKQIPLYTICKKHGLQNYAIHVKRFLISNKLIEMVGDHRYIWNQTKAQPNEAMYTYAEKELRKLLREYKPSLKAAKLEFTKASDSTQLSDEQLVAELRSRGYTVTATKEIKQTIQL